MNQHEQCVLRITFFFVPRVEIDDDFTFFSPFSPTEKETEPRAVLRAVYVCLRVEC